MLVTLANFGIPLIKGIATEGLADVARVTNRSGAKTITATIKPHNASVLSL
jgi:hypothetical protein